MYWYGINLDSFWVSSLNPTYKIGDRALLAESEKALSAIEITDTSIRQNSIAENSKISVDIQPITSSSQIGFDENGIGESNVFYPGSTQSSLGEINTVESTFNDNSIVQIGSVENSSTDKGFREMSSTQVGIDENSFINFSPAQVSPTQISPSEVGFFEFSSTEIGISAISPTQISPTQISPTETGISEISSTQISPTQISPTFETGISEISPTQISPTQISLNQLDLTKISFSSSISPEQFFSVHNSTPKVTNVYNNTATNIWSDLLQSETQLDIDFQIIDLPKGKLRKTQQTILIDHDTNDVGWFINKIPLDNSKKI